MTMVITTEIIMETTMETTTAPISETITAQF
jgi:hypothetical protein